VQGAHAACQLVHRFGHLADPVRWGAYGPHFVWYGVRDEAELLVWERRLGDRAVASREPDRAHELTALAYWGPRLPELDSLRLL
jgi:hypothetical protein